MTDIIERLNMAAHEPQRSSDVMAENKINAGLLVDAAYEITRLRGRLSAALEDAAKVAEELTHVRIEWPISGNTRPHEQTQKAIASAIRSLKDKP